MSARGCRTSQDYPLRIDEVAASNGTIGITFCPGKQAISFLEERPWCRDLSVDLDAIRDWGAKVVVTLIEDHEFASLHVLSLGDEVRSRGMAWVHLPITDGHAPDDRFEDLWTELGPGVLEVLRRGGKVLVHCRGGLGRAGLVSARMLIELGEEPRAAMRRVRAARVGAIENTQQESYLVDVGRRLELERGEQ